MLDFLRIGRNEDNDVRIDNPYVSGNHAVLFRTESGFQIFDLRSRNGIYVNGERVGQAVISHQDRITLGKSIQIDLEDVTHWFSTVEGEVVASDRVDFLRIGKSDGNEIHIDDERVSRYHAIVSFLSAEKGFHIFDLRSSNGLYVNGEEVEDKQVQVTDSVTLGQEVELSWGQVIRLFSQRAEQRLAAEAHISRESPEDTSQTAWIREQLMSVQHEFEQALEREHEKTEKEVRQKIYRVALAGSAVLAALLCIILVKIIAPSPEENVLPYRDSVVLVIHQLSSLDDLKVFSPSKREIGGENGDPHRIVDIGGTRIKVFSQVSEEGRSYGSGFLYTHQGEPYIITNKHVVQPWIYMNSKAPLDQGVIKISLQDYPGEYTAQVVRVHPSQDVAILKFKDIPAQLSSVDIETDWEQVGEGDKVICMSFPLGLEGQVSKRIKADLIQGNVLNKFSSPKRIKYDLVSAPGASGGPVFNKEGKVIAINQGGSVDKSGNPVQGINWGIPISRALEILH